MRQLVILIACLITMVSIANSQVFVGASSTFSKFVDNNPYMEQEFTNRLTLCELNAGIFTHKAIIEGFHLLDSKRINSGNIITVVEKKPTVTPVVLFSHFNASRIEVGYPIINKTLIIEPFFAESFVNNKFKVKRDKIIYAVDNMETTAGFGVASSYMLRPNHSVGIKYLATSKDSLLNIRYTWFNKVSNFNVGYTQRAYSNIKLSGPYLSVSYIF